jgi:hypothetical protein
VIRPRTSNKLLNIREFHVDYLEHAHRPLSKHPARACDKSDSQQPHAMSGPPDQSAQATEDDRAGNDTGSWTPTGSRA